MEGARRTSTLTIDVQLPDALNSKNEKYIKDRCRERLKMAGTYVMLIGQDTWLRDQYVLWEAEVAIEKKCNLIGVNLDKERFMNPATCPFIFQCVEALFVPFSPQIVAEALNTPYRSHTHRSYYFDDATYQRLGYIITGNTASRPPKPNPFAKKDPPESPLAAYFRTLNKLRPRGQ
jgi:hypothetical protein